ncbi:MAG: hypothetical protein ACJ8NR_15390 [Sulfurifustis sp.]
MTETDERVAVKPGQNATIEYLPAVFGEYTVAPPYGLPNPEIVCDEMANGPVA